MTESSDIEKDFHETLDYLDDPQYANAVFAIGRVETDNGGITLNQIWKETEILRNKMMSISQGKRALMVESLSNTIKEKYKDTNNPERTQMCILLIFALRLIKAADTIESNPHSKVIREIVRLVGYRAQHDPQIMAALKQLVQTIDDDGDRNEKEGLVVPFGDDILKSDTTVKCNVANIIDLYINRAYDANIIGNKDAFDQVWEDLLHDDLFVNEMNNPSLGKDYNLLLIFNVFGLMFPWAYTTKVRGAKTLAMIVGERQDSGRTNHYAKEYFNTNEIEKLKYGIKSREFLNRITEIIKKHRQK